jgi:hypothetical protein
MESSEFNPYAAPLSYESGDALTEYYRADYRGLTYREYWRISINIQTFLVLVLMKTLRLRARRLVPNAFVRIKSLNLVPRDDVPPEVWEAWSVLMRDCGESDITLNFVTRSPIVGPGLTAYSASLLAEDEMTAATLTYERVQRARVDRVVVGYGVTSMLPDGRYAMTSGTRVVLDGPKEVLMNHLPGATIPQLLTAHRQWVANLDQPIVPMSRAGQAARVLAATQLQFDHFVRRKFYVPMTEKEFEAIARLSAMPPKDAPPPETKYARFLTNMGCMTSVAWVVFAILLLRRPSDPVLWILFGITIAVSIVHAVLSWLRKRYAGTAGRGGSS